MEGGYTFGCTQIFGWLLMYIVVGYIYISCVNTAMHEVQIKTALVCTAQSQSSLKVFTDAHAYAIASQQLAAALFRNVLYMCVLNRRFTHHQRARSPLYTLLLLAKYIIYRL
jgi:hypothetical protein